MSALSLPTSTYRHLDRATKVLGVVCIAAGLQVGGDTLVGIALATLGVVVGTITIFITPEQ